MSKPGSHIERTSVAIATPAQVRKWHERWWLRRIAAYVAGAALAASCGFLPEPARGVCATTAALIGGALRESVDAPSPAHIGEED